MIENVPSGRLLIGGSPRAGTAISCGNTTTHLINKALERCKCNGDFSTVIASWTAQRVNSFGLDTPSHNADARWALEWRNPARAISAMLWPSVMAIHAVGLNRVEARIGRCSMAVRLEHANLTVRDIDGMIR